MLMSAATILLLSGNVMTDVPQKKLSSGPQEILGDEELQVFEAEELVLDDSPLSEVDPELVEFEE